MNRARTECAKAALMAACCVFLVVVGVLQHRRDGAGLILVCAIMAVYFAVRARRATRAGHDDSEAP